MKAPALAWLRNVVLGLDDGLVTVLVTLLMVSSLIPHLLIGMVAVVLAGTVSMGLGGYASSCLAGEDHPILSGLEIGAAFLLGGIFPLIPIALGLPYFQVWSCLCAALVAFGFGALKGYISHQAFGVIKTALFFLAIVAIATLLGIGLSLLLR